MITDGTAPRIEYIWKEEHKTIVNRLKAKIDKLEAENKFLIHIADVTCKLCGTDDDDYTTCPMSECVVQKAYREIETLGTPLTEAKRVGEGATSR